MPLLFFVTRATVKDCLACMETDMTQNTTASGSHSSRNQQPKYLKPPATSYTAEDAGGKVVVVDKKT
jgi:hypothetical protein